MSCQKALRILVAEDNAVNQAVIRGMLEHAGHHVSIVPDGQSAIHALTNAAYDLVIMDCVMPVMDGFEATRAIRASTDSSLDPAIPILAITALSTPEERQHCLDAGMNGHISKPVIAGELFAWLARQFGIVKFPTVRDKSQLRASQAFGVRHASIDEEARQADLRRQMSPAVSRDAKQWVLDLQSLLADGNRTATGHLAHKIRGTADIMGYQQVSELAARLEMDCKTGKAGNGPGHVSGLILALEAMIVDLQSGH